MAKERIRPGGLYIADNVLWHGRVAVERYVDIVPGWTEAILEHNTQIFNDPEFDAFINPTRDGVIVARKKTSSREFLGITQSAMIRRSVSPVAFLYQEFRTNTS